MTSYFGLDAAVQAMSTLTRWISKFEKDMVIAIQVHGDLIHASPSELHPMAAPWSLVAWVPLKVVTKKAVVDFMHSNIICRFGIPKTIIMDNAANLNSHLIREVSEQFKITHWNSTPYRPKANGVVEAANKNVKKILRKMIQSSRQWHEKLPFA
uniref:Uncharacterized protein LOC104240437 n=1 Tax=Nicotiana sylvestris TaxID=4096 RepID=A0A1U7XNG4_NICSY|nr:PREDICTED: uncharacterized protein LOC104240437 [Nicotiana sylvestris]